MPKKKKMPEKQKLIPGPIIGYKGTNKNMVCNGFQFVMGKNFLGNNDDLVLCQNGFHFCQQPSGPFAYKNYDRIFKVKAFDILDTSFEPGADYKQVCKKVEFIEEIIIDGNRNTGHGNTGHGNATNYSSGFFCKRETIVIFDRPTKLKRDELDWQKIAELSEKLSQDEPFDVKPFLSLPNATKYRIKSLHKKHIELRKCPKK